MKRKLTTAYFGIKQYGAKQRKPLAESDYDGHVTAMSAECLVRQCVEMQKPS